METNLRDLIACSEYLKVFDLLKDKTSLTMEEQKLFAISMAYTGPQSQALSYLLENSITCPRTEFDIYFLNGDYDSCAVLLDTHLCPYQKLKYYLALGNYELALQSLKGVKADARWYYEVARVYGHQSKYDIAVKFLEKSKTLYLENGQELLYMQSLGNLGNYLNLNNQFDEAEMVFHELRYHLNRNLGKTPRFLKARLLMNIGHFQMEKGQFFLALVNLTKAHRLLEKNSESNEFIRVSLLLANFYLELGYYSKVIRCLNFIKPKKSYQVLDHHRYMGQALIRMGKPEEAILFFDKVKALYKDALEFHLDYVPVDLIELDFFTGSKEKAKKDLKKHLQKIKDKNPTALWYCINRWNRLSSSNEGISHSLSFHKNNRLKLEWIRDCLLNLNQAIANKQDHLIDYHLNSLRQEAELPSLYSLELKLINSFLDETSLDAKTEKSILKAESTELKYKFLALELFRQGQKSFLLHKDLWNLLKQSMGETKLYECVEAYLASLNIQLNINTGSEKPYDLILDRVKNEARINGETVLEKTKKPKLWQLFQFLSSNSFCTKEDIFRHLYSREYNPETDNNNVYVSINRLNQLLGEDFKVESQNGKYYLPYSVLRIRD